MGETRIFRKMFSLFHDQTINTCVVTKNFCTFIWNRIWIFSNWKNFHFFFFLDIFNVYATHYDNNCTCDVILMGFPNISLSNTYVPWHFRSIFFCLIDLVKRYENSWKQIWMQCKLCTRYRPCHFLKCPVLNSFSFFNTNFYTFRNFQIKF